MTYRPPGAPMPEKIRHFVRAIQHPARAVDCPHCGARDRSPCKVRSSGRLLTEPHPGRITAWVRATTVCPGCEAAPHHPCHADGRELPGGTVHPQRVAEAERTAA